MAPAVARRRLIALLGAIGLLALIGVLVDASPGDSQTPWRLTATLQSDRERTALTLAPSPFGAPTRRQLPPQTRVVAFTGAPQHAALGILGVTGLERGAVRLARQAAPYRRPTRPVTPAFDLIATVAEAQPGPAGLHRTRQSSATIARWLRAARRHDTLLMLDVQPGTSNFPDEVRALARWLREPDVHLALDPEWRMRPGVAPGTQIGWVSHGELQATLDQVASLVRAEELPHKLVLVHQFTDGMVRGLAQVRVPREIVPVISIDGVGSRTAKIATYRRIAPALPRPWRPGFKVFYEEDEAAGGRMSGAQVMALVPRPVVVLYE